MSSRGQARVRVCYSCCCLSNMLKMFIGFSTSASIRPLLIPGQIDSTAFHHYGTTLPKDDFSSALLFVLLIAKEPSIGI